ncbi:sll0787 family AIR synthase-like protein [Phormidium sp. FACHB-1136]|uniref:sll0787 family AIR synthase-like protein n=1 Tax=Phormidium sp. FACHB-1136 TaxID=2692848 RepID=UPI001682D455|nr:sll0787 family AIR synthase-like protein [Phormidium sp. FACHB-1136]MBD2424702.1 sll0787 family AIR synthase-like protein [Phormidium sp. FACHB-1136]
MLTELIAQILPALGLAQKQDIQIAARHLGQFVPHNQTSEPIALGDDCAAIPDGEGYLLLAAEGLWPPLVEADPWFAGWSAVLVNVSDIYAMGGRPLAVVDALWSPTTDHADAIWQGMLAASQAFNVPIVGGHTNCHSPYNALSVAILGRANQLISSFAAQPSQMLVLATQLNGQLHPQYPFWDGATQADPAELQRQLAVLPAIADQGLCSAGKDVSMGGILGTTLMLLETSGCGAVVDVAAIPCPDSVPLETWLRCFPSYGFLLTVEPQDFAPVQQQFQAVGITCVAMGKIVAAPQLTLTYGDETAVFWDFSTQPLTGFSPSNAAITEP